MSCGEQRRKVLKRNAMFIFKKKLKSAVIRRIELIRNAMLCFIFAEKDSKVKT
jgi:Fe-S cluster biosynthesis and repair protein YggX